MSEETRGSDDAAEEHVAEKQQGFARPDGPGGDQLLVPRHEAGAPLPTHLDGIEQPPPPPYQESPPLYQDAPPPYQPQQQQQPGYGEQPRPGFAPAAPGAFWPGTRPPQGPPQQQFRPPMGGGPGPVPPNWAPVPPPPSPSPRSGVSLGAFAIIALVIALIAGAVGAGVAVLATDDSSTSNAPVSLKGNNEQQVAKVRDPKSVAGVAQQVLPSVVTVKVDLGDGKGGTGTGFIVQNGYVITNNHVIAGLSGSSGGSMKIVFSDGKESPATVKGTSASNDVAVIKPETTHNLPPLELGNSDDLAQGDPVIAVGSPLGLQGSVTTGIISALNRVVPTGGENGTDSHVIIALQTDAAINPGNSGGPLIDATTGKVIGVNTAIASLGNNGQESGSIGLGFALPINRVQSVATSLISGQSVTKTVIGISMDTAYQGEGVKIATSGTAPLTKGGPAEKAGLKPGDVIITADGKTLNTPEDLLLVVTAHAPGDKIKVTYKRGGQDQTVEVTLGAGKS
jgi:putative serine protease PepD